MAITKFSNSSLKTPNRYNDFLAGNSPYDPGGYWPIASAVTTSGQTSVTFGSIPQTYTSLQIRYTYIPTTTNVDAAIRFNSVTTGYWYHWLRGTGTAAEANGYTSMSKIELFRATTTTNTSAVGIVDILDYTSTTNNKTVRSFGGFDVNGSGQIYITSGSVANTSAITSLTILAPGNFWTTGATFELYGIKEV